MRGGKSVMSIICRYTEARYLRPSRISSTWGSGLRLRQSRLLFRIPDISGKTKNQRFPKHCCFATICLKIADAELLVFETLLTPNCWCCLRLCWCPTSIVGNTADAADTADAISAVSRTALVQIRQHRFKLLN